MSRNIVSMIFIAIASVLLGVAINEYGSAFFAEEPASPAPAQNGEAKRLAHLEKAAEEIAAAARQGVADASSEERAIQRTELSVEALRLIGLLGDENASTKAEKLLDDLQKQSDGALVHAIIQIRMARKLRQWPRLEDSEREQSVERFIADVKAASPEPAHAEFLIRMSEILSEAADTGDLAARAVSELAPVFRTAKEPEVQRVALVLDGIARRLTLLGKPMELEGTMLDGEKLDWDSYRGKVVLVDFWNSGCSNCRAEAPNVMENYQAYHDKGFEVISVNLDTDPELAKLYMEQTGFDFPTLFSFDPEATGWSHPMARMYGVTKLPVVFLVDQNGIVVNTMAQGPMLGAHLRELLGAPADSKQSSVRRDSARQASATDDPAAGGEEVVPASATSERSAAESE